MESNTTTARVIYRVCQQVVNVYQHGGHHDQIDEFPVFAKE
jgi:hypothetical protein